MPLHKVEDLIAYDPQMLACFVTLLIKRWEKVYYSDPTEPFLQKVLGIITRNGMRAENQEGELQRLMAGLEHVSYDASMDQLVEDEFGPIDKTCARLPASIEVHFIGQEADIQKLDRLLGAKMIGIDTEWRPALKPFSEARLAILQLGTETDAFIIDLIALQSSQVLDQALSQIFQNKSTTCLGFSFSSDAHVFQTSLPSLSFYKLFSRFLDLRTYFQKLHPLSKESNLSKVVQLTTGQSLCKGEQMSDWEKRPLR